MLSSLTKYPPENASRLRMSITFSATKVRNAVLKPGPETSASQSPTSPFTACKSALMVTSTPLSSSAGTYTPTGNALPS